MKEEKIQFLIGFGIISLLGFSLSLPADFNFNGNIQKVNYLHFNSYFYGRESPAIPTIQPIPTANTPIVTPENLILETKADKPASLNTNGSRKTIFRPGRNHSEDYSEVDYELIKVGSPIKGVPITYNSNWLDEETGDLNLADDEERITLYSGINPNYSFNETLNESNPPNKLISAPGCPKSADKIHNEREFYSRHTWVHYGNPPRCYLVGVRGPCKEGMLMGRQSDSFMGKCKCECFLEAPNDVLYDPLAVPDPYLDEKQNFCYDGIGHLAFYEDKCYSLLSRGPCRANEVFTLDTETKTPICQLKECPVEDDYSLAIPFLFNGKCTNLGESCDKKEIGIQGLDFGHNIIGTTRDNPVPTCITSGGSLPGNEYGGGSLPGYAYGGGAPAPINKTKCKEMNQKYSKILAKCLPHYQRFRNFAIG